MPNGNSIMLVNLVRLGMMDDAQRLADSLNGYLNVRKLLAIWNLKDMEKRDCMIF